MTDGLLSFIVPVRHQDGVADWQAMKRIFTMTLRSMSAQTTSNWNGIVIANEGADLPALPERFEVVRVNIPYVPLPARAVDSDVDEIFWNALRDDKARRVWTGLRHLRPRGHVMVVDYDDFVSRRLAELVGRRPDANGWFFDSGYLYSGSNLLYRYPAGFSRFCGTSHIVRADLLEIADTYASANKEYLRYQLGAHRFIQDALEKKGSELERLPFDGAIYRIGHAGAVSGSPSLLKEVVRRADLRRHPAHVLRLLTRLRPLFPYKREFFGSGQESR